MKLPPSSSNQNAASPNRPDIRIAARSLVDTPTTLDWRFRCFRTSPIVNPSKFTGDADRPGPPSGCWKGSSTTLTIFFNNGSHQSVGDDPGMPWMSTRHQSGMSGAGLRQRMAVSGVAENGSPIQQGSQPPRVDVVEPGEVVEAHLIDHHEKDQAGTLRGLRKRRPCGRGKYERPDSQEVESLGHRFFSDILHEAAQTGTLLESMLFHPKDPMENPALGHLRNCSDKLPVSYCSSLRSPHDVEGVRHRKKWSTHDRPPPRIAYDTCGSLKRTVT